MLLTTYEGHRLVVFLAALMMQGCGETTCTMDTECPLPQVCVDGRCLDRTKDGITDMADIMDLPGETPDADAGDLEPDVGPCTPAFADHSRTFLGSLRFNTGWSDDPDHPDLVTLENDQIWIISRLVEAPDAIDTPKLTVATVNAVTGNPSSTYAYPIDSIELNSLHPIASYIDASDPSDPKETIAIIFQDVSGFSGNQMMYMPFKSPPMLSVPVGFTGTNEYSTEPDAASSNTELVALWRQGRDVDAMSRIDFGIVDTEGVETTTGTISGDFTQDLGQPVIVPNGTGYGVAYFVHAGAGIDVVELIEIDATGTVDADSAQTITVTEADKMVVGRPTLAWNGESYALAWEESGGTGAHFHFSTIESGGGIPTDTLLDSELSAITGALTNGQAGMIDIEWTGERYGLVWVHENPLTGTHVWFFETNESGSLVNGPSRLNPEATQSFHPKLIWFETSTSQYYVFTWNEFTSTWGWHVLYTYTYGC